MSIRGTAVDAYLKVVRVPMDLTAGRIGGEAAQITVDRVDAAIREVAGMVLLDDRLRTDAVRLRRAADERERALRLRADAEQAESEGEERAQRQRAAARRTASQGREQAERRARKDRLEAAEEKAAALEEAEEALDRQEEPERLKRAAAKSKETRKRNGARTATRR